MQLAKINTRPPHLVQAIEALSQHNNHLETAQPLLHELSGITALVAKKFTNDRTAEGLLEAFYLTIGCISLGISQANIPENSESQLDFLLHHGAEYVFQMGFRQIKELSSLPYDAFVSDFDNDPFMQQRNLKVLFYEICRAEPASTWSGGERFKMDLLDRRRNQTIVECAKWLRKNNSAGPIKDPDLDANAVVALAVIFAISGDGRIVARAGQKEIENLIYQVRDIQPDVEVIWNKFLQKIPVEYQTILRERMNEYKSTIVKKLLSKSRIKTVLAEIQNYYAGNELNIDYP